MTDETKFPDEMSALEDGRSVRWYPVRRRHCDEILEFLDQYYAEHRYMPSRRDIAVGCRMVVSSVHYYLGFMSEDGLIEVNDGLSRAIRITDDGYRRLLEIRRERLENS